MSKNLNSTLGLILVFVLLFAVNIAGKALGGVRADLTDDKLYTLSDGAKNILAGLDKEEPIKLRYYFSEKVADKRGAFDRYSKRVRDMLNEFERAADGGLVLEELDPEPFSKTEDQAVAYGLQNAAPRGWGESLYFGLVAANSVGDEEVIPFFVEDRESFLEHDLARLLYTLNNPELPVLGVLSSLPLEGSVPNPMNPTPPEPWFIAEQMRQAFDVRQILPQSATIPDDVDVLLIVHPKSLSDPMLYAIDQFALSGRGVVAMVDPHSETEVVPADPQNPMQQYLADRSSQLEKLFDAWGVRLVPEKILADNANSPFAMPTYNQDTQREETVRNVLILSMLNYQDPEGELIWSLNQDEVATSSLKSGINFRTAGVLEKEPDAQTEFVPLVQSSEESLLIDKSRIQFQANLSELLADFTSFLPASERYVLAARVSGQVQSAFPGGDPAGSDDEPDETSEEDAGDGDSTDHLTSGTLNAIVVSDVDFLHDSLWVRDLGRLGAQRLVTYFGDNGNFVVNALDNLAGSTDLISLRGRGGSRRPFTLVQELEREAERELKSEEDELLAQIQEAERKIADLQKDKEGGSRFILSPEQQAEIDRLVQVQLDARERLREVRYELRKDIDSLGTWVKAANVGLIPAILTALAIVVALARGKRRQSARASS